jgi:molybdopterin molybdotransferase
MIELATARAAILQRIAAGSLPTESLPLAAALGRVSARAIAAPGDVPGFAHSAMDGYALRAADLDPVAPTRLALRAVLLAGAGEGPALGPGDCVRIMTGAPMPPGADTVVIRENAREEDGVVVLDPGMPGGSNVRAADDDFARGDPAIAAGELLGPAALAVLASFGQAFVDVRRRPRIGMLVTGDELVAPGGVLAFGQRHDSNRTLLDALARVHGASVARALTVGDDETALETALRELSVEADLVITSGGASAGDADFLPAILARIGEVVFWKVAMKPGMPAFLGLVCGTPVFGLPGNPVSVFATFIALVRPALAQLCGAAALDPPALSARLDGGVAKRHGRLELRRGRLRIDAHGVLRVALHPSVSSGALRSVLESDVLVELAAGTREWRDDEIVPVHPLAHAAGWP